LLREDNPKANHIVWAYRHFNDYGQIVENCDDDKEPKNSSAPPILNVMRGEKLINCAILVVRYFGGVKLGIGGLVRAYKLAAQTVIQKSDCIVYEKRVALKFFCKYSNFSKIEYIASCYGVSFELKEFNELGVDAKVSLVESKLQNFQSEISLLAQNIKVLDTK